MLSQRDEENILINDDCMKHSQQMTLTKLDQRQQLSYVINETNNQVGKFLTHEQKIQATYNFQYLFRKKSNLYKMNKNKKNSSNKNSKNENLKNGGLDKQQKVSKKGHWSTEQNKKYHWFLEIYNKHFILKHLRRTDKIFKTMSTFIGTREAEQCRSHHQKMQKKYKNFYQILIKLRMEFYRACDTQLLRNDLEIHGYFAKDSKNQKQLTLIEENSLKTSQIDHNVEKNQESISQDDQEDIYLKIHKNLKPVDDQNISEESDNNQNQANLFLVKIIRMNQIISYVDFCIKSIHKTSKLKKLSMNIKCVKKFHKLISVNLIK